MALPETLITLLGKQRGIPMMESMDEPLPLPHVFPDMPRAIARIRQAIDRGERIGIFGDYDCDGVTATALLLRCLRRHGVEPLVRLPHRERDGYGLKQHIAEEIAAQEVQLLLTVDTGITAISSVAWLQEKNIDVIITDHHHAGSALPSAYAIVHPALAQGHPLPHPSGAGVALQLVRALENGKSWEGIGEDLALAAIGTVADLVPLSGGNRTLVRKGVRALASLHDCPLATLRDAAGCTTDLRSTDVAFRIAPRINAAGRLDDPILALKALLVGGTALAKLEELNTRRQRQTEELFAIALEQIDASAPLLCIADERFHPGIVGLIAGKLTERFGRPSLVGCIEGTSCTASLRSPASYHIAKGLGLCTDLLIAHGGHAQAAGCTFEHAQLDLLRSRLTDHISPTVPAELLTPALVVDAILDPAAITLGLCTHLDRLEPFGQENPEPRFLLRNVRIDAPRVIGSDGSHLQGRIANIKTVGFRLGSYLSHTTEELDLVCRIGLDTWQGRRAPQIFIEDMRVATWPRSYVVT